MNNPLKVLHISTHNEVCGIGRYQEMYLNSLEGRKDIQNKFFELSPNKMKVMATGQFDKTMHKLEAELNDYDILHVQHEFAFYRNNQLMKIVSVAKKLKKRTIITVHTSPDIVYNEARLTHFGPRSIKKYFLHQKQENKHFRVKFIEPLLLFDRVIVHNEMTAKSIERFGVSSTKISVIDIPVPVISNTLVSSEITNKLKSSKDDIVYSTIGFVAKVKGIEDSIKALQLLPDKYKLAIIGGIHPESGDETYFNQITNLIVELGLQKRVYVTGFVEDDNKLNALIRESDICVYPYDKYYYSRVSSAALNNAFANHKPVITYPTESFKKIAITTGSITLTKSFNYYELAREIVNIDLKKSTQASKDYSEKFSYTVLSDKLVNIYEMLASAS